MDQKRLLDYLSLLKHQIASQEILGEYHGKIEAMIEMMLTTDLVNYPQANLHNYLWVISDLIGKAETLNRELLDMFTRMMPLLEMSDNSNHVGKSLIYE